MEWLIVVGGLVALLLFAVVVAVVVLGVGGFLFTRRKKVDPEARNNALAGLGYRQVKPGNWSRQIQGTSMSFDELSDRWKWTVRLPRYNTMTLRIEEQGSADAGSLDGVFASGDAELDARFVMASGLAARTQALVNNRQLRNALLAMPNLSLELSADELIIADLGHAGLLSLTNGAEENTDAAVDGELQLHGSVSALVNTFFRSMYNEAGTVFDEHR
ncbi:MAG: hypothetical protein H6738_23135 [Alphaproteobacteria bacterium]|nr:hypothetical protein [Alphaproteobacteria bacterium]MCB9699699.1 hypothetical protein [Alphaproteobacteria bacterium]